MSNENHKPGISEALQNLKNEDLENNNSATDAPKTTTSGLNPVIKRDPFADIEKNKANQQAIVDSATSLLHQLQLERESNLALIRAAQEDNVKVERDIRGYRLLIESAEAAIDVTKKS